MTDTEENNKGDAISSEELIAQAYAALKTEGGYGLPLMITDSLASVQSTTETSPLSAQQSKAFSGSASAPGSESWQQSKPRPAPLPTQKPVAASYRQPAPRPSATDQTQAPSLSGTPGSPMGAPVQSANQPPKTTFDSQHTNAPGAGGDTQSTSQQQQKKQSGWSVMVIWLIIIVIIFSILPNLHLFD